MNKYSVTYAMPYAVTPGSVTEEVEAAFFKTQATSGAHLVADFYDTLMASDPSSTFSCVISVKKVSEGVFLTNKEARIAYTELLGHNDNTDALRLLLINAFADPHRPEVGSGGKGQVPWTQWGEGFPPGTFNSSEHDPS